MKASQNMKSGFSIEQQISAVNMTQNVRSAALHDARIAELLVNAITWVCGKFEQPSAQVFAKPSPKY